MATLSNIFGPQGMTGSPGSIGLQGMTGPQGAVGPTGYVGNMYEYVMERYQKQGLNMIYETETGIEIKIKDMDDVVIKNCITTIKIGTMTEVGRAWLDIFADVTVIRRKIKLEKIKSKMVCQQ